MRTGIIVSCEHASARVPNRYLPLFAADPEVLATHRALDIGSLRAARILARRLDAPLVAARVTRLLVDANRSLHHPRLFSEFSRQLPPQEREALLARYYHPYRDAVTAKVEGCGGGGLTAVHLSVHSFAPSLRGAARRADIGLLYDPAREPERDLCRRWQAALLAAQPGLRVRRNYPYRGVADGLVRPLRVRYGPRRYLGIELEMNQAIVAEGGAAWRRLAALLADTLKAVLAAQS